MYTYMYIHVLAYASTCQRTKLILIFQSALGWDYQADLAKHGSQTDASKGFGGKYGVQKDLKDKVHVCTV